MHKTKQLYTSDMFKILKRTTPLRHLIPNLLLHLSYPQYSNTIASGLVCLQP
jgi:hypothetical protein